MKTSFSCTNNGSEQTEVVVLQKLNSIYLVRIVRINVEEFDIHENCIRYMYVDISLTLTFQTSEMI